MKFQDKRFLSDRGDEGGSFRWTIDTQHNYDNVLIITDCYKVVTLEFSFRNNKELEERIEKVDNMIDSLLLLKESLKKCHKQKTSYY